MTTYLADDRKIGVRFQTGAESLIFQHRLDELKGPPGFVRSGNQVLFPRGQSGRAWSEHVSLSSIEVMNAQSCVCTPECVCMAWRLIIYESRGL